jgi:Tfp pilus assembly protein PilF
MKKLFRVLIAFLFIPVLGLEAASAEEELFSLQLSPGMTLPLGQDAQYFTLGGGGTLLATLAVPGLQFLHFDAAADFSAVPVQVAKDKSYPNAMLEILSGSLGGGVRFPILTNLLIGAYARGGYFYGFTNFDVPNNTGSNGLFTIGAEIKYRLLPSLSLGIDAAYRSFFGLSNDMRLGLGVTYIFPVGSKGAGPQKKVNPQLELRDLSFNPVFPVFYKYFSDHPMGSIVLFNKGKIPIEKVTVKAFVNQYMDNPFLCKEIPFITGGGKETVDLFALFNDKVLGITENTKVQISITVESEMAGESYGNGLIESLRIYDRNAMTWEDDRRAAAFVSLKDPSVLRFSKNVSSDVKDRASKSINKNFLLALAFFETMRIYGLTYAVDPTSPFTELSVKKTSVDFLQFPNQTLDYKAGDCDDLSILYTALLESVGVTTAFLTTPGHIFVAVSLGITPAEAKKQFAVADDFIFRDDMTWLPVEVTALGQGFLAAWQSGSNLWKEQEKAGQAHFTALQDAWRTYEPVGFDSEASTMTLPTADQVVSAYLKEVGRYIDRDLYPQTRALEKQIAADPRNLSLINKLGVLNGRYGLYDKAEEAFQRVLKIQDYQPALLNMGNLMSLKDNLPGALRYYQKALAKAPNDASVLLSLARTSYALGRFEETQRYFSGVQRLDAALAGRFAYLGMKGSEDTTRAAQAELSGEAILWGE